MFFFHFLSIFFLKEKGKISETHNWCHYFQFQVRCVSPNHFIHLTFSKPFNVDSGDFHNKVAFLQTSKLRKQTKNIIKMYELKRKMLQKTHLSQRIRPDKRNNNWCIASNFKPVKIGVIVSRIWNGPLSGWASIRTVCASTTLSCVVGQTCWLRMAF